MLIIYSVIQLVVLKNQDKREGKGGRGNEEKREMRGEGKHRRERGRRQEKNGDERNGILK